MVDFNNDNVLTANKAHILELVILGRRDEMINTFQLWAEAKIAGQSKEENLKIKLRAVMLSVFLELERPLSRKLIKRDAQGKVKESAIFDTMRDVLLDFSTVVDDDELVSIYFVINTALDEMNLIKIDNKRVYDSTSIETENSEKCL